MKKYWWFFYDQLLIIQALVYINRQVTDELKQGNNELNKKLIKNDSDLNKIKNFSNR